MAEQIVLYDKYAEFLKINGRCYHWVGDTDLAVTHWDPGTPFDDCGSCRDTMTSSSSSSDSSSSSSSSSSEACTTPTRLYMAEGSFLVTNVDGTVQANRLGLYITSAGPTSTPEVNIGGVGSGGSLATLEWTGGSADIPEGTTSSQVELHPTDPAYLAAGPIMLNKGWNLWWRIVGAGSDLNAVWNGEIRVISVCYDQYAAAHETVSTITIDKFFSVPAFSTDDYGLIKLDYDGTADHSLVDTDLYLYYASATVDYRHTGGTDYAGLLQIVFTDAQQSILYLMGGHAVADWYWHNGGGSGADFVGTMVPADPLTPSVPVTRIGEPALNLSNTLTVSLKNTGAASATWKAGSVIRLFGGLTHRLNVENDLLNTITLTNDLILGPNESVVVTDAYAPHVNYTV